MGLCKDCIGLAKVTPIGIGGLSPKQPDISIKHGVCDRCGKTVSSKNAPEDSKEQLGRPRKQPGKMEIMLEAKNALDMMMDKFGPGSAMARGMFPPGIKMGAPDENPPTYAEFMADVMVRDRTMSGSLEHHVSQVALNPFEYLMGVWHYHHADVRAILSDLSNLRETWLRHIAETSLELNEEDRARYTESAHVFFEEHFADRSWTDLTLDEKHFWSKEGNKEIWLISMALALPRYMDMVFSQVGDSRFLTLNVADNMVLGMLAARW